MSHALRKAAWMLAVVPLTGLVLAGCGGGGSDSTTAPEQTAGVLETSAPEVTVTAESTERYDITVLMVCDAVESALAEVGPEAPAAKYRTALRKSLNTAFRNSTTPDKTIADVKVDRFLNQGCPGSRAKALVAAEVYEISEVAK